MENDAIRVVEGGPVAALNRTEITKVLLGRAYFLGC